MYQKTWTNSQIQKNKELMSYNTKSKMISRLKSGAHFSKTLDKPNESGRTNERTSGKMPNLMYIVKCPLISWPEFESTLGVYLSYENAAKHVNDLA